MTDTTSRTPETKCLFLELPQEIRDLIYELALATNPIRFYRPPSETRHGLLPLVLANRQIYAESLELTYSENMFKFYGYTNTGWHFAADAAMSFLDLVPPWTLPWIRHVHLTITEREMLFSLETTIFPRVDALKDKITLQHLSLPFPNALHRFGAPGMAICWYHERTHYAHLFDTLVMKKLCSITNLKGLSIAVHNYEGTDKDEDLEAIGIFRSRMLKNGANLGSHEILVEECRNEPLDDGRDACYAPIRY
ncbi:hypothetical protein EJ08DRAFT_717421 [Tothia fuscella]|uniref:Uncharacterized protein n=1 Tax=Tothia fuscella TaxID=1048955 RepID=A0A9P4TXN2_9PEZI|nr:hypothetical protein EJ08DRAFT_717421 [Tothia fuscella]